MAQIEIKLATVRLVDIDGTIVKKRSPEERFQSPEAQPGAIELVNSWVEQGDYVYLWTARDESIRKETANMLDELGFKYHGLIMNKPYSHNIHIYDDNPITAHRVSREHGITKELQQSIQIETLGLLH